MRIFLAALFLTLFSTSTANASIYLFLDFDGTLVADQGAYSTWRTPWILRLITKRRNMLQPDPTKQTDMDLPDRIEVSVDEYLENLSKWGKGDQKINSLIPIELKPDFVLRRPTRIIPGYYTVEPEITFENYRPNSKPLGNMVRDWMQAVERTRNLNEQAPSSKNKHTWRGLAFPLFKKAMAKRETVENVTWASARWPADNEVKELLTGWREAGEINFDTGEHNELPRFDSLNAPTALLYERGNNLGALKAAAFNVWSAHRLSINVTPHMELAADPVLAKDKVSRPIDTMIVAEDDPRYVESLRRAMEARSGELHFAQRMKFVLLNATKDEAILKAAHHPYRYTVFHSGHGRPATAAEIRFWTEESCSTYLDKK